MSLAVLNAVRSRAQVPGSSAGEVAPGIFHPEKSIEKAIRDVKRTPTSSGKYLYKEGYF